MNCRPQSDFGSGVAPSVSRTHLRRERRGRLRVRDSNAWRDDHGTCGKGGDLSAVSYSCIWPAQERHRSLRSRRAAAQEGADSWRPTRRFRSEGSGPCRDVVAGKSIMDALSCRDVAGAGRHG